MAMRAASFSLSQRNSVGLSVCHLSLSLGFSSLPSLSVSRLFLSLSVSALWFALALVVRSGAGGLFWRSFALALVRSSAGGSL